MGNCNNFFYYDASFLFLDVNTHWHNIIKSEIKFFFTIFPVFTQ